MPIRIGVTGGRDYTDQEQLEKTMDMVLKEFLWHPLENFIIVHGDARGADFLAKEWAISRGIAQEPHKVTKADIDQHGKYAYILRNQEMADSGLDVLVAFPGGNGTANMRAECHERGIRVIQVHRRRI
jgi:hypothetical protein